MGEPMSDETLSASANPGESLIEFRVRLLEASIQRIDTSIRGIDQSLRTLTTLEVKHQETRESLQRAFSAIDAQSQTFQGLITGQEGKLDQVRRWMWVCIGGAAVAATMSGLLLSKIAEYDAVATMVRVNNNRLSALEREVWRTPRAPEGK
jgi:hypothetical protein